MLSQGLFLFFFDAWLFNAFQGVDKDFIARIWCVVALVSSWKFRNISDIVSLIEWLDSRHFREWALSTILNRPERGISGVIQAWNKAVNEGALRLDILVLVASWHVDSPIL